MITENKISIIAAVILAIIVTLSVNNNSQHGYEENKHNVSSETSSIIIETNQNVNSDNSLKEESESDLKEPEIEQEETKETTTKKPSYTYENMSVPKNNSIKSYMDFRRITLKSSRQYKLQKSLAYTGDKGIRMVGDRYCVAVGSYYTTKIGQYIDIELANGNVIHGILADCKDDRDTDSTNRINPNGSVVEFVVDTKSLDRTAKVMGDISYINDWNSKVVNIKVYDKVEEF